MTGTNDARPFAAGSMRSRHRTLRAVIAVAGMLAMVPARADVLLDSAFALIGQELHVPVRLTDTTGVPATVSFSAIVVLGNETMFYPERLVAAGGGRLVDHALTRVDERTWRIRATIERGATDTLFVLAGEALAGYDSVSIISLDAIVLDGIPQPPTSARIHTRSVGTPLPYVRFARLEQGYPNPAARGTRVTWYFQIDKPSPVRFGIYAINGERLVEYDFGVLPAGRQHQVLEIGFDVPSAPYFARLTTNSGESIQFFHVVK